MIRNFKESRCFDIDLLSLNFASSVHETFIILFLLLFLSVRYVINLNLSKFILDNQDIVLDELNVKSFERITEADQLIEYKIKPNLRTLGKKYGKGLSKIKRILTESNTVMLVKELKEKHGKKFIM